MIANRMVESQPPTFRVTRITSQGDTVFSRFYPYEPVTTPDAAVDAAARRITENIRRASQGNVNVPVGYVRSRLFVPDHLGPITDLSVGDGSAIWIRREDSGEGPVVWEILDGSGRKRGFVRVPRELDIEWATLSDAWAVGGTQSGAPLITRFAVRASP